MNISELVRSGMQLVFVATNDSQLVLRQHYHPINGKI
jgi:hypothetical protein